MSSLNSTSLNSCKECKIRETNSQKGCAAGDTSQLFNLISNLCRYSITSKNGIKVCVTGEREVSADLDHYPPDFKIFNSHLTVNLWSTLSMVTQVFPSLLFLHIFTSIKLSPLSMLLHTDICTHTSPPYCSSSYILLLFNSTCS